MEQFIMKGGNPLVGEVTISGAKNAALGILAASILTDEDVLIENLPDVRDINVFLEAVSEIGAMVDRIDRHTVRINAKGIHPPDPSFLLFYWRPAWQVQKRTGSASGRMQHRQPSDRPAFKGLPCPRCEGAGGKWRGARTCD